MKRKNREHLDFIGFLEGQSGSSGRANLAELRRAAANLAHDYRDIRVLVDYLPDADAWSFDAHRLTASLFTFYAAKFWGRDDRLHLPRFSANEKRRRTLGTSLQRLKQKLSVGQESLDLRFSALLDTPREDLAVPLRGIVQRIATAEQSIPIDFRQLLNDLLYWNADHTRRNWAMDYWQAAAPEDEAGNRPEEAAPKANEQP